MMNSLVTLHVGMIAAMMAQKGQGLQRFLYMLLGSLNTLQEHGEHETASW